MSEKSSSKSNKSSRGLIGSLIGRRRKNKQSAGTSDGGAEDSVRPVRFPKPVSIEDEADHGLTELPEVASVPDTVLSGMSVRSRALHQRSRAGDPREDETVMLHESRAAKVSKALRSRPPEPVEEDDDKSYAFDTSVKLAETAKNLATRLHGNMGTAHAESRLVQHSAALLGIQLAWLESNVTLLRGKPLDSMETLARLYERARQTLSDDQYSAKVWTDRQTTNMVRLDKILEGGPRYLFMLSLFEALAYQVELVSPKASEDFEAMIESLRASRKDAEGLNQARLKARQILQSVPKSSITDKKGRKAWNECIALLEQMKETNKQSLEVATATSPAPLMAPAEKPVLRSILKDTKPAVVAKPPQDTARPPSRAASAVSSVGTAVTARTSPEGDEDDDEGSDSGPSLLNYNGQVVTRSAMELLEEEEEMIKRGLYERDGVIMTASALSLLQAQEAMERGDSAGHGEWGPDTWDGIRGQYIPKWARKLTVADQWPLVDEDGKRLRDEQGKPLEDWFDVNLDAVEARNALLFGLEGVVDHPY